MNQSTSGKTWLSLALVTLVGALVLLTSLGGRGLNEPDEGRYAEIGREMAAGGSWLMPHLNGIPHLQKPPMVYWATALSLKAFGINEFAARLPSALAALGTLLLTWWIGRALFGESIALLAALLMLSSLEFFVAARLLTPDMLMTFWITLSIGCLVQHVQKGGRGAWAWGFFIAAGLGFMTKGPMAFVVPISAAIVWQQASRRRGNPFRLPWLLGMALALAIALSWFVAVSVVRPELIRYFAGYELIERFATSTHGRHKPAWFFLWVLPAGIFPWTLILIALLWTIVGDWRQRSQWDSTYWLLAGWIVPPLVVLSASGSKLPTYILPLFPALVLALALWLESRLLLRARTWLAVSTVALIIGIEIALHVYHAETGHAIPEMAVVWAVALIAGLAWWMAPRWIMHVIAVASALAWVIGASQTDRLTSSLEQQATVRDLAFRVKAAPDFARATIFACEVRAHGWEFYLNRVTDLTKRESDIVLPLTQAEAARIVSSPERMEKHALKKPPAYGLVREEGFERDFSPTSWKIIDRAGDFLLIASVDSDLATRQRDIEGRKAGQR